MNIHPFHKKLARALDRMGGLFTVQDILNAIAENKMQSFVEGESWAVTQIAAFPRATVLEIVAVVGDLDELRPLHDRILAYAAEIGASLVQAYGREGWLEDAKQRGWRVKARSYLYQREM